MNVLQGFGYSLLQLVVGLLWLYTWVIIIRVIVSWVSADPYNPIVQILYRVTEPVLRPFRRLIPPGKLGGLDLSPLFAILILQLVRGTLIYSVGAAVRF